MWPTRRRRVRWRRDRILTFPPQRDIRVGKINRPNQIPQERILFPCPALVPSANLGYSTELSRQEARNDRVPPPFAPCGVSFMARAATPYPASPSRVPEGLTVADGHYKLRVFLVLLGLIFFFFFYLGLVAGTGVLVVVSLIRLPPVTGILASCFFGL